jgi:hypothetical protein
MRKALNDNPVVQIGALAALALLVGFLLLTRMSHKSSETSSTTTPTASSSASVAPTTSSDSSAAAPSTAPSEATAPTPAPSTQSGAATGNFVAGPGLPAPVVNAYKDNRVVVLLVVRRNGIDDDAVRRAVQGLAGSGPVALFVTNAGHIARYSRIATGVNVDRVPALIVLRPRKLNHGATPQASVSYGFRSASSVVQAIRDAVYKGPTNEPYYPK